MADELDYVPMPDGVKALVAQAVGRDQGRRRASRSRSSNERPAPADASTAPTARRSAESTVAATLARRLRFERDEPEPCTTHEPAAAPRRRTGALGRPLFSAAGRTGAALLTLALLVGIIVLAGRRRRRRRSRSTASASSWRSEWDPVQNELRRPGDDLRHAGHLAHRAADRRAGELRHRAVPDRAVAGLAEAPARHRDRAAGRGAVDRLRHVGPAGVRPDPGAPTCSSRCRRCSAACRCLGALVSGPAGGHRHPVGRHHPGDHDHPVHRLGDARRVRGHAADAEGVGLRRSAPRPGKWCGRSCCPTPRPASSAASCSGLGRALGETMAVTFVIGNINQLELAVAVRGRPTASPRRWPTSSPKPAQGLHQASLIYLAWSCSSSPSSCCRCPKLLLMQLQKRRRARSHEHAERSGVDAAETRAGACIAGRKRVNAIALTLSLAAMAFGLFWLIWILFETVRLGIGGLALATLHRDDAAAAGRDRRPRQRDLRLADDGGAGDAASARRSASWPASTWPSTARSGWLGSVDALHQRHPAVGAVDRDRPVRLRGGGRARQAASPAGPACWRWR